MKQVQEVIIVEGRYDKHRVSQAVNATVLTTSGFSIINNKEKVSMLRRLAEKRGLIILTDGDRAGFFIRSRLKSMLNNVNVKHAYIPDIKGQEKRKDSPSKEGKLGVEGMSSDVIINALELAGATFNNSEKESTTRSEITKADLFEYGLSGCKDSAIKRRDLLKTLDLPERLPANGLLDVLNILYSREDFISIIKEPSLPQK